MKIKLSAIALLAVILPGQARAATLTDAEATFLDELVTAAAVLEQRCSGYEVDGAGSVRLGARLLGSTDAAMAMIAAFDAAIKARFGNDYDPAKLRPEVSEAAGKAAGQLKADLTENPKAACTYYGDASVASGLMRRY